MAKRNELKKLAVLFPIILLAGCINLFGTTSGNGPGLTIVSFSPSDTTVEPGTPVDLSLVVQNNGGDVARNIHATLGGLTDDWQIDGRDRSISDIAHTDPARGINTAMQDQVDWTLVGPTLSTQLTYQVSAQVNYDYSTTLDTLVRATSFDYYRINKPQTGVIGPSTISNGPISITVKAPNSVFAGSTVPVYVEFHNTGSGRVSGPAIDTISVAVSGEGISCQSGNVRLIQGKDGFMQCTVSTIGIPTFQDFRITVSAFYTYTLSATTQITVLPRAG